MNGKLVGGLVGLAMLAAAPGASAHHSTAMFDQTKTVEITGTVKEFQYTNPHSWLIINELDENGEPVLDEAGEPVVWGFEAEGPTTLMRRGIGRNTFPEGMEVVVRGRPMKDGRPAAAWINTTLPDGSTVSPTGR